MNPTQCQIEQAIEKERDRLAKEIAEKIKLKTDWKTTEYGAIIYINAQGLLRYGTIQRLGRNGGDLRVSRALDETIVGIVHNHPIGDGSAPGNDIGWPTANMLVSDGRSMNQTSLTTYSTIFHVN